MPETHSFESFVVQKTERLRPEKYNLTIQRVTVCKKKGCNVS